MVAGERERGEEWRSVGSCQFRSRGRNEEKTRMGTFKEKRGLQSKESFRVCPCRRMDLDTHLCVENTRKGGYLVMEEIV